MMPVSLSIAAAKPPALALSITAPPRPTLNHVQNISGTPAFTSVNTRTELTEDGWIVLRFWGRDIKRNCSECADKIEKVLGDKGHD